MFKKLLPFVVMAFVSACANTQESPSGYCTKMSCCETCECCVRGACDQCCKENKCSCCQDGACKSRQGKETAASATEAKPCPLCDKSERKWQAKRGMMKH